MMLLHWNRCVSGYDAHINAGGLYIDNTHVGSISTHPTDGYSVRLKDFRVINAFDLEDLVRATLDHLEQPA